MMVVINTWTCLQKKEKKTRTQVSSDARALSLFQIENFSWWFCCASPSCCPHHNESKTKNIVNNINLHHRSNPLIPLLQKARAFLQREHGIRRLFFFFQPNKFGRGCFLRRCPECPFGGGNDEIFGSQF